MHILRVCHQARSSVISYEAMSETRAGIVNLAQDNQACSGKLLSVLRVLRFLRVLR
jgi:hypothetical protein